VATLITRSFFFAHSSWPDTSCATVPCPDDVALRYMLMVATWLAFGDRALGNAAVRVGHHDGSPRALSVVDPGPAARVAPGTGEAGDRPGIGRPITGTLSCARRGRPVRSVPVRGELYIGRCRLGDGAPPQPSLVSRPSGFLSDPFASDSTTAMYRTGDFASSHGRRRVRVSSPSDHPGARFVVNSSSSPNPSGVEYACRHGSVRKLVWREPEPGNLRLIAIRRRIGGSFRRPRGSSTTRRNNCRVYLFRNRCRVERPPATSTE